MVHSVSPTEPSTLKQDADAMDINYGMVAMNSRIRLTVQEQTLEIAPSLGAAITAYYSQHKGQRYDWLRATSEDALLTKQLDLMSSFVMAPWCGRIEDGHFNYHGKAIYYPSLDTNYPHSRHGFVRDRQWLVEKRHSTPHQAELVLSLQHMATSAWPFSFMIKQQIVLSGLGLQIHVQVENIGANTMPFAMGHHPFFPCNEHTLLSARVQQAWHTDERLMPLWVADHPLVEPLAQGLRIQAQASDTIFTGWSKRATIYWPDQARQLRYHVSGPMDFFVLYHPEQADWFCAEPFGNITNAFNLRQQASLSPAELALIGGSDLAPGSEQQCWLTLSPMIR